MISQKQAIIIMMALLIVVLTFHALVLIEVIPYDLVWAGKLTTTTEMWKLELISMGITAFAIIALALKANYIQHKISIRIVNMIMFLLGTLFSVNTVGNLFAETRFELYFFTPLTLCLAILCFRIVFYK